ncbi:sugar ABC transporter substrate-binding protein [Arthrobacter psychrolactophilus]|uniref:Sugar ABC transporter substrate-binding protein n=1 Tax=Arthrobacter psychrolactophilus TaxID=92442 RepID=A0A2V5IVU6_9MICC|nr:extracellular solute-binding protein [Arthrobacter psychrolactophilus]PYI40201.1 sugar ABC transporter substrate-binding protein [Arthrobacter psychrolactophilus]
MKKHDSSAAAGLGATKFNRRSFLGLAGISAVALSTAGLLTSCGKGAGTAQVTSSSGLAESVAKVVPSFIPMDLVTPDIASVNGSTPGYVTIPDKLVKSVTEVPGKGGKYKAMTPAWWTVPPALADNSYYQAVNKAIGATVDFQVNDGNSYGDKIQTVLASPKDVPDWVVIPSWNLPPRFSQAVTSVFEDLSPHLAGDKIKKYPNLANLPTAAWKYGAFAGGLYGLPYPSTLITDAFFYRKDVFTELGLEAPKTADEYISIAKELTDPAKKRWGSEDVWSGAQIMFGVAPKWKLVDGALVNKIETDEYRAALEWIAKLFASGAVHPDAVAGNQQQSKSRFESGASLMASDGLGSWHESLGRVLPTNPKYDMAPMDFFAPDGGDPTLFRGSPASIFSFIKKNSDSAKIEEMLSLANFFAAPFGTEENQLINYGVEGVHFTKDSQNIPQSTDKGLAEVTSTYSFLVSPPVVNSKVQYPGYVKTASEWEARQAPFVVEEQFFGLQIEEPNKFGSLGKPFDDLAKDIARGRKKISDLDTEIATWKKNGGDELREFYTGFLSA